MCLFLAFSFSLTFVSLALVSCCALSELSRWVRAMYEAISPPSSSSSASSSSSSSVRSDLTLEELVRLWAHEALRLFQDRLVDVDEKDWTDAKINEVATKHFSSLDADAALRRPILFSNWCVTALCLWRTSIAPFLLPSPRAGPCL
jgi:hypothetical protein